MYGTSGDVFSEVLVKKKLTTIDMVVRVVCTIVALVAAALFLLFGIAIMFIVLIVVLAVSYFIIKCQKIEYEYIFTSGDLDFDQLTGDFRRKRKLSLNLETMTVLAPEDSHYLDGYQHGEFKIYDFSSRDKTKKRYVYVGTMDDKRIKVVFEPNEKMLDNMYLAAPSKVKKV